MMSNAHLHRTAVGQLVLAALCWSLGGLLIKAIDWPPLAVAGGRGILAAVFLMLTNGRLHFTFSRVQVLAAFAYAGCTVFFVAATKYTTAANAILLQYTAPVWIALLGAWLLGEPTTRRDWIIIAVVFVGMGLFFADGLEFSGLLGNVFGVVSGLCFAAMTIALRKQKDGSPVESIILGNLIAFVVGLPFMIGAPLPSAVGWGALLALGIVQLGCSYWLYARAIRRVTALEAVIIPVFEPILNPVWVFLARGEQPGPWALLGGVIVLGAVTWQALGVWRTGNDSIRHA
ncbi:MAG: DMT family transporter [Opitutaceae bacterium]|nr:DMT family transporter [Cephaloticoccus sp.]MCP5529034.1 DMT family transporter [Opitutaceae bacterium]